MKPAERAGELTQQHIDGILSPAGREELEALLRDHPDARAAYLRELRLHAALCVALRGVRGSAGGSADSNAQLRPADSGSLPRLRSRTRFSAWAALATAACLAIVVGTVWRGQWLPGSRPELLGLRLADTGGAAMIIRAGRTLPALQGAELRPEDRLETPAAGSAVLRYANEDTRFELGAASTASFHRAGDGKRVRLALGRLACFAAPQHAPLEIETPHATAVVVGTVFRLTVTAAATELQVDEGKVAFRWDGRESLILAGQSAVAGMSAPVSGDVAAVPLPDDAWLRKLQRGFDLIDGGDKFPVGVEFKSLVTRDPNAVWMVEDRAGEAWRCWSPEDGGAVFFDFERARWNRGLFVVRFTILPEGKPAARLLPDRRAKPVPFKGDRERSDRGQPNSTAESQQLSVLLYRGDPAGSGAGFQAFGCPIALENLQRGVRYRCAAYFDADATTGTRQFAVAWPDDGSAFPAGAEWKRADVPPGAAGPLGLGISTQGVPILLESPLFIPGGPDLPRGPSGSSRDEPRE